MAINDNRSRIQFRRGTGLKLTGVTNEEKIAYGQPIYNVTKNYLTIGDNTSGGKLYKNLQPIDVRRVKGYFDDAVTMSGVANEDRSYDILGGTDGKLQIKSSGNLEFWASNKAFNSGSTAPLLPAFTITHDGTAYTSAFVGKLQSTATYLNKIYNLSNGDDVITFGNSEMTIAKPTLFSSTTTFQNTMSAQTINAATLNSTNINGLNIRDVSGILNVDDYIVEKKVLRWSGVGVVDPNGVNGTNPLIIDLGYNTGNKVFEIECFFSNDFYSDVIGYLPYKAKTIVRFTSGDIANYHNPTHPVASLSLGDDASRALRAGQGSSVNTLQFKMSTTTGSQVYITKLYEIIQ